MEHSQPLDSHLNINLSESKIPEGKFGVLIVSIFLDRFAFYGFRAMILIYALDILKLERNAAIYDYGTYVIIVAFSSLLGGIVGDFLLPSAFSKKVQSNAVESNFLDD